MIILCIWYHLSIWYMWYNYKCEARRKFLWGIFVRVCVLPLSIPHFLLPFHNDFFEEPFQGYFPSSSCSWFLLLACSGLFVCVFAFRGDAAQRRNVLAQPSLTFPNLFLPTNLSHVLCSMFPSPPHMCHVTHVHIENSTIIFVH